MFRRRQSRQQTVKLNVPQLKMTALMEIPAGSHNVEELATPVKNLPPVITFFEGTALVNQHVAFTYMDDDESGMQQFEVLLVKGPFASNEEAYAKVQEIRQSLQE
jgi:hypothetical protein